MRRQLPPFETVTEPELRTLWTQHRDADVRRLILEVARYRLVIKELDGLYKSTHLAWRTNVGGDLVALHMMLQVLTVERQRLP
jgi:hypothetical protein